MFFWKSYTDISNHQTIIHDTLFSTDDIQEIKHKMNNSIIYDYYQDKVSKVTGFFDLLVKIG